MPIWWHQVCHGVGASTIGAGRCAHGAARVASGNFAVVAMPVPVGMGHGEEPPKSRALRMP